MGVLMLRKGELTQKESITFDDIKDKPLIVSKEISRLSQLVECFHNDLDHLNIVSYYSRFYNASLMVENGLGYTICYDKLINTFGDSALVFRPFEPVLKVLYHFIWKKYHVLTKASQYFLNLVQEQS